MNGVSCITLQKRVITGGSEVREAYLETAEQTQTFVEVLSPTIHPVNMTSEHKIAAVIRGRNHLTLEITEQASASFLKTLLGVISNAQ